MIIPIELLLSKGAIYESFAASEIIFTEGSSPKYYFQIIRGIIELNGYETNGKEFTHDILSVGRSVGDALIFGKEAYPMTAVAHTPCTIIKLRKDSFLDLLKAHPDLFINILKDLSEQLYFRYQMHKGSTSNPRHKIIILMEYLKESSPGQRYSFQIPLTRRQIANLLGIREETVIRAVKMMEKELIVKIKNGKIFY